MTLAKAFELGFGDLQDDPQPEDGGEEVSPAWPPPPSFKPLSSHARGDLFGVFSYVAAPTNWNPEGIRITDNWAQTNLAQVEIPQLVGVSGAPKDGVVTFHKAAADQLKALWQAWEDAGLKDLVLNWAGSYAPRFIRGSRTYLSNHAWATAFDINVPWNGLGAQPALVGQKGSVRKLAPIAAEHGFYWGGWYNGRKDGMHFEVAFLK